jgi:hypothetical protein
MRPSVLLTIVLATVLAGLAIGQVALAEAPPARPAVTVEAVLPGCRSLVATQGVPTSSEAGFCSGLIDGLLYLGAMIPADFCFVVPPGVPQHRVVAAIVEEIEAVYPSVKQQHFRALAIDVLEYKWPCHVQPKVQTRE